MPTEIERVMILLQGKRYVIGAYHDGPKHSFVTFYDPHTLTPAWNGPNIHGRVEFRAGEIMQIRSSPDARTRLEHKVREAEQRLFEDLDGKVLMRVGVSLALTLLMIYPVANILS